MFTFQSRVEVLIEEVEGPLISPLKDNLYGVLQVDAHFVRLQIVLCALAKAVPGPLCLALQAENAVRCWSA